MSVKNLLGRVEVVSIGTTPQPYGLIVPEQNVVIRTWIENYFAIEKIVDFVWLVGDYNPDTKVFTYYLPILYLLNVSLPAETAGYFDTPVFLLPATWGSGYRAILVWACDDFNPDMLTCTGLYDEHLKEDAFIIEGIGITDVTLLPV